LTKNKFFLGLLAEWLGHVACAGVRTAQALLNTRSANCYHPLIKAITRGVTLTRQ